MNLVPASRVRWIVIHYSASPIERAFTFDALVRAHRARGFREPGYHRFIRRSGAVHYGRDIAADGSFEIGAQSKGENDESVGLCYEGGVRLATPNVGFDSRTPEQTAALIREIDALLSVYGGDGLDPAKGPVVTGHRDMPGAATQCPGFDASAWWASVLADRRAHEARTRHLPSTPAPRPAFAALLARAFAAFFATFRSA